MLEDGSYSVVVENKVTRGRQGLDWRPLNARMKSLACYFNSDLRLHTGLFFKHCFRKLITVAVLGLFFFLFELDTGDLEEQLDLHLLVYFRCEVLSL